MHDNELLILRGPEVLQSLRGNESKVIQAVRDAYVAHQAGKSFLPHSVFVRFPGRTKERIIALPGYLGGNQEIAGIKWISSFPNNLEFGISRASAVVILNSLETGRPTVMMEGSLVSSARTAASAALAADVLHKKGDVEVLGMIGCGLINREISRFVCALGRKIQKILIYDIDPSRGAKFAEEIREIVGATPIETRSAVHAVLAESDIVSFATTAVEPTVDSLSMCKKGSTILHISLRDLKGAIMQTVDNVVDDVDHVMRAQTSLHLAEQLEGHRDFVRCTLAEVLNGSQPARKNGDGIVVFSPFGLGVLDLAVSHYIWQDCAAKGIGTRVNGFFDAT